jgi:TonB family protein
MIRRTPFVLFVHLLFGATSALAQGSAGYKVIVNPVNPTTALSKSQISSLFLRRTTTWENGEPVLPVDQVESSPLRETFSRDILGMSPSAAAQQAAGRGDPAPSLATDREVLAYVRLKPGAIGYVSSGTPVEGVKVVNFGHAGPEAGMEPVKVGGSVAPPAKIVNVQPVYPPAARAQRVEGTVDVEIVISPTGTVEQARVVKPAMFLNEAALNAVRQWKFAPTVINGVAVSVKMIVKVAFVLQ